MSVEGDVNDDLIDAALAIIAERGFIGLNLRSMAEATGQPLSAIYGQMPDGYAVIDELGQRADDAMLDAAVALPAESSPKDRLFELIMARLDYLEPYRGTLKRLRQDARSTPAIAVAAGRNIDRAARHLVDAAKLPYRGLRAQLAAKALGALLLRVLPTYLEDEGDDLPKTMAMLDRQLNEADQLARWFG